MAVGINLVTVSVFFAILNLCLLSTVNGVPGGGRKKVDDNIVGLNEEEYKRYVEQLRQMNKNTETYDTDDFNKNIAPNDEQLRTRIEEAKRLIVDGLRNLGRFRQMRQDGLRISDHEMKALNLDGMAKDMSLPDIDKLMHEKLEVLQALDNRRKEAFKDHEMGIEAKRREKLKKMNERDRLKAEEEYKKHEDTKKQANLHHPASKEQMEDVWEKEDEMPREDFEPKKFFLMHDGNGDHLLDPLELEAMFYGEVKDVYSEDHDQTEMREEMSRMREHVMKEIDKNEDGMISMQEFVAYTDGNNYEDKDWEDIDDDDSYTDDEMDEYMRLYGDEDEGDDGDGDALHHDDAAPVDHDATPLPSHAQGDDGTMNLQHNQPPPQEGAHPDDTHHDQQPTGLPDHPEQQEHTEQPEHTEAPPAESDPSPSAAADGPAGGEDQHQPDAPQPNDPHAV